MKELIGADLFDLIEDEGVNAICITTNCSVSSDGTNPMGGGCAGAAARRYPRLEKILGQSLLTMPNVPFLMGYVDPMSDTFREQGDVHLYGNHVALWSYPTMHEIGEPADLKLVLRSAELMMEVADSFGYEVVCIPRPGCGIGGLDWETEVKPALEEILDYRFYLVHKEGK